MQDFITQIEPERITFTVRWGDEFEVSERCLCWYTDRTRTNRIDLYYCQINDRPRGDYGLGAESPAPLGRGCKRHSRSA